MNKEDKEKFIQYCMQTSNDCRTIIEELEKLGPEMRPLIQIHQNKALAYDIVYQDLRMMETQSIGTGQ